MRFMARNFGLLEFDPQTERLTSTIFDHEGKKVLTREFDTRAVTRVFPLAESAEHYLIKNLKHQLAEAVLRGKIVHLFKFIILRFYKPMLCLLVLALATRWVLNKAKTAREQPVVRDGKKEQ